MYFVVVVFIRDKNIFIQITLNSFLLKNIKKINCNIVYS